MIRKWRAGLRASPLDAAHAERLVSNAHIAAAMIAMEATGRMAGMARLRSELMTGVRVVIEALPATPQKRSVMNRRGSMANRSGAVPSLFSRDTRA
jgi:hypothetical protein